jgi:rubrerythrin
LFGEAPREVSRAMIFDIEAPDYDEARAFMSPREALLVAMHSEQKAHAFFQSALPHLKDADVLALFEELAAEEVHHQDLVARELAKLPEGDGLPLDAFVDDPIQQ